MRNETLTKIPFSSIFDYRWFNISAQSRVFLLRVIEVTKNCITAVFNFKIYGNQDNKRILLAKSFICQLLLFISTAFIAFYCNGTSVLIGRDCGWLWGSFGVVIRDVIEWLWRNENWSLWNFYGSFRCFLLDIEE